MLTRVTNQIIGAIEAGPKAWRMPWHTTDVAPIAPISALSKKPYRGVNVLALWATAQEHDYSTGLWGTYRQWEVLGAHVRKEEKGSCIVVWKLSEKSDSEQKVTARGIRFVAHGYWVFNASQVDGFTPPPAPEPQPEAERIETTDRFFAALRADIRHGGEESYYSFVTDHIQMPRFKDFPDRLDYYATLAHEATHWTGAENRLNRQLRGRFGLDDYIAEEQIAELGAAFLMCRPRFDQRGPALRIISICG